jgi:phage tail-like protein
MYSYSDNLFLINFVMALRNDPLLNYRFSLTVPSFLLDVDCGFMEISGFSSKVNGDKYKEGGSNLTDIFLPTGVEWGNLVAKRGVVRGSLMITWIKTSINTFSFTPMPINVTLWNDLGMPELVWTFLNAYPVSLSTSNLNAGSGGSAEVLVDTIEFRHDGCVRVDP